MVADADFSPSNSSPSYFPSTPDKLAFKPDVKLLSAVDNFPVVVAIVSCAVAAVSQQVMAKIEGSCNQGQAIHPYYSTHPFLRVIRHLQK